MLAYHLHHQRLRHVLVVQYLPRESSKKEVDVLVMGESKVIRYHTLSIAVHQCLQCYHMCWQVVVVQVFSQFQNSIVRHLETQEEEVGYATYLVSYVQKFFLDFLNSRTRPIRLYLPATPSIMYRDGDILTPLTPLPMSNDGLLGLSQSQHHVQEMRTM